MEKNNISAFLTSKQKLTPFLENVKSLLFTAMEVDSANSCERANFFRKITEKYGIERDIHAWNEIFNKGRSERYQKLLDDLLDLRTAILDFLDDEPELWLATKLKSQGDNLRKGEKNMNPIKKYSNEVFTTFSFDENKNGLTEQGKGVYFNYDGKLYHCPSSFVRKGKNYGYYVSFKNDKLENFIADNKKGE